MILKILMFLCGVEHTEKKENKFNEYVITNNYSFTPIHLIFRLTFIWVVWSFLFVGGC